MRADIPHLNLANNCACTAADRNPNTRHLAPLLLLLAVLTGCSHSAEQTAQTEAQVAAANDASDDAKCKALYLVPNTPAYQKCRDQLTDQREQTETNERAAVAGRLLGHYPGN